MVWVLENEFLSISVQEKGAELCSVVDKQTGKELLWGADPEVWNRHAPLLFPYCGGLYNNEMLVDGQVYDAPKHGFARNTKFDCILADAQSLVFELKDNDETRAVYPFAFILEVCFTISGKTMKQKVTVKNPATLQKDVLPFSLGFHPGFVVPFGENKQVNEYEIYFDELETPIEIKTPDGYVSGEKQTYFTEQQSIVVVDDLFAFDSICLSELSSKYVGIREIEEPSNFIRVNVEKFPFVLLWSAATKPAKFVCIEPWNNLPDGPDKYDDFRNKPGNTLLAAGEKYETTLEIEFHVE